MKAPTKTQINALNEIIEMGGCIASHWTSGSGNYITRRATPVFCETVEIADGLNFARRLPDLKGYAAKCAKRLLKAHPKAQKLIICTNIRAARKALKAAA